jgi:hypothetical protein
MFFFMGKKYCVLYLPCLECSLYLWTSLQKDVIHNTLTVDFSLKLLMINNSSNCRHLEYSIVKFKLAYLN